jgi:hypothetical protein
VATIFETFVTTELPVRSAMLTNAIASYNGDPNGGGAPPMVANAPTGTFFLQETGLVLWQKVQMLFAPNNWQLVGGGVSGISSILYNTDRVVVDNGAATATSKIIISWLGDHGATRSWVDTRISGHFTVYISSNAPAETSFVWEILNG